MKFFKVRAQNNFIEYQLSMEYLTEDEMSMVEGINCFVMVDYISMKYASLKQEGVLTHSDCVVDAAVEYSVRPHSHLHDR